MNIKYKDDYELVDKYIQGNEEAGRILYAQIYEAVKNFIYNRTNKSPLTESNKEDIIMETFETSIRLLNRYTGESKFLTFVIGIAKNKIREYYKKLKVETENVINNNDEIYMKQLQKNPIDVIVDKEKNELINKAINSLSPEYMQIIRLRSYNNVPYKDISKITGKSISALESLFRRAIKKLKKILIEFDVF